MKHAFPTRYRTHGDEDGMTLRDYFAAQALAGLLAYGGSWPHVAAERAYEHADAMLKARDDG